jgi:hypothetical protein
MSIKNLYPTIKPSLLLDFAKTKRLDPRITFARASTGACYDGKTVAKAEENLLTYSQEFNVTWVPGRSSVIANATTAPDGTTTADIITATATGNPLVYQAKPFAGAGTISCYVKKGTSDFAYLYVDNPSFEAAYFNISTGVVGSFSSSFTATSITAIGDGWYRCVASFTSISGSNVGFGLCDANGDGFCTVGKTIFAWGAQLEQRSSVTAYTPTTSQPITNYIPVLQTVSANTARFDHDPVTGESKGLLIEEQRTNLKLRSEEFDSSIWQKSASTIASNATIAPNGELTANKLIENTTNAVHFIQDDVSGSSIGSTYSLSIYAKPAGRNWIHLVERGTPSNGAYFDILNGQAGSTGSGVSAFIQNAGNGWYRCIVVITSAYGGSGIAVTTAIGDNNRTYTGDGYSGVYIWGAQLEAGAFPTSYIKTEASQVTRSADSASITGTNFSSWYIQNEGTFYYETNPSNLNGCAFSVFKSGTAYRLISYVGANLHWFVTTGAGTQVNLDAGTFTINNNSKLAGTYQKNSFAVSLDGGSIAIDSSGDMVTPVDFMRIGSDYLPNVYLNGTIKKISYYPERLTNEQLQALTKD